MRICKRCLIVDGVDWYGSKFCLVGRDPHQWRPVVVLDCPYMTRTATGRLTTRRIQKADRACSEAGEPTHNAHHYGDRERRHFVAAAQ